MTRQCHPTARPRAFSMVIPLLFLPVLGSGERLVTAEIAPDRAMKPELVASRETAEPVVERRKTVSIERLKKTPTPEAVSKFQESWAAFEDGDMEKATRKLEDAIEKFPDFIEAHNNLGYFYWLRGDYAKGLKEFEKTVQLDPTWASALVNLALSYYSTGDHENALEIARRALEIQPHSARAHYTTGLILLLTDERRGNEALSHFKRAINDFPQARLMAAYLMLRLNRPAQAEQALTQYIQAAPLF